MIGRTWPAPDKMEIKPMLSIFRIIVSVLALTLFNQAQADSGQQNIPGIERAAKVYKVPDKLAELPTQEIFQLRDAHQKDLQRIRSAAYSQEQAEAKMLEELLAHDLVRLSIVEVIPQLIEEYAIEGEFKNTLLGYRSTFIDELMASRKDVASLGDYQAYDFRFAAVYMSMLFSFQDRPDFYQRLKADMLNERTSIGGYRKLLDDSYGGVQKARERMDTIHSAEDLEHVIAALNAELARRD